MTDARWVAIGVTDLSSDRVFGAATLIEPALAVTTAGVLSPGLTFRMSFASEKPPGDTTATISGEVPGLNLDSLTLNSTRTVLPIGELVSGPCESIELFGNT